MQVSDKETRAVFLNFKEMRCLEKNLQALDIEKAYSISLINLDQKVVKLSDKRLRDKVSKIKSHLPEGDIDELRWLDKMGKLGTAESASKINCKVRIAAAEKRLKLQPRAKSAVPCIETMDTTVTTTPRSVLSARRCSTRLQSARSPSRNDRTDGNKPKHPSINFDKRSQLSAEEMSDFLVPRSIREERRKSIYLQDADEIMHGNTEVKTTPREAFVKKHDSTDHKISESMNTPRDIKNEIVTINVESFDEDSSANNQNVTEATDVHQVPKPNSLNVSFLQVPDKGSETQVKSSSSTVRPASVPATKVTSFAGDGHRAFTSMSHLNDVRKKCAANIRRASRLIASGKTITPFSCHDNAENEEKTKSKTEKPFRSIRDGLYAEIEKGPMENALGSNLHKEIKRGLILGEVAKSLQLEDKIDAYMDKIQSYVKSNPTAWEPHDSEKTKEYYTRAQSGDVTKGSKDKAGSKAVRNKVRRQQLEFKLRQGAAQDIFLQNNFADIKKSRYLRIPDSMIDLSGMNTLAVDQMKMLGELKSGSDWKEEYVDN